MLTKSINVETREEIEILPGDCLLYRPKGKFGWLISLKTWHMIGHCECFIGEFVDKNDKSGTIYTNKSVASRDGKGVDVYDFRVDNLCYVLRPPDSFNLVHAMNWFDNQARGQKYDWLGLLRFGWRTKFQPDKMAENKQFCSEFLARFYNKGDWPLFNTEDCDSIAPFEFLLAPFVRIIKLLEVQ